MVHVDMFCQEKFLLNGVELKLKLHRKKNAFCLLRADDPDEDPQPEYRVQIKDATLFVRSAKLNPTLMMQHTKDLERGITAKYPIRRVDVKSYSVPQGNLSFVRIACSPARCRDVSYNNSYNGAYDKEPYNFKHFDLNYLALHCNGETVPWKPLRPRFNTPNAQDHIMAYQTLFQSTNILHKNQGIPINREEFTSGYSLFAFDLSSYGTHLNSIQTGSVRLELQFKNALPNTVNLVVYAEWDSMVEINKSRHVISDFEH